MSYLLSSIWYCRTGLSVFPVRSLAAKAFDSTDKLVNNGWPFPLYTSDIRTDRKSIFLAHASHLPSSSDFPVFLDHLTALPRLKRATHCMYAFRCRDSSVSNWQVGQNDGGENGSGDWLARLLELSACENAVVVVSRWYGGVKLGSDRWKRISEVAKEALERGGLTTPKKDKAKKKGKRKRSK